MSTPPTAHGHEDAGGIEWEDDMVEVNKLTTPANMRWKLVDRSDDAENHAIEWQFRVGDRVKIRLVNEMDSDHPMHHPFHIHGAGRFLILARDGVVGAEPGVERHRAGPHRRDRRHRARRHQRRALDGALPHRRAPRERHDVQLRRDRMSADADRRHAAAARWSSSAAARPAWPSATSWPSRAAGSPSWRRPANRPPPGGPAGTRCELFTPVRYDSLPGPRRSPATPDSYPGRDDVVAYLTDYAQRFELPVEFNSRVAVRAGPRRRRLPRRARRPDLRGRPGRGRDRAVPGAVHAADRRRPRRRRRAAAQQRVPLAGRPARRARCWSWAAGTPATRSPRSWPQSREVHLAVGARQTPLPQRILGRDLFRYLEADRPDEQDRDLAPRAAAEGQGDAHRLQPPRARASRASGCGRARPAPRARR